MTTVSKNKIVVGNIRQCDLVYNRSKGVEITLEGIKTNDDAFEFLGYENDRLIEQNMIFLKLDDKKYADLLAIRGILFEHKVRKLLNNTLIDDIIFETVPSEKDGKYIDENLIKYYYPENELEETVHFGELNKALKYERP